MKHLEGINGICYNCWNITLPNNSIVYIDPPYQGTTKYGHEFNYLDYIKTLSQTTYCSEAIPLTDEAWLISSGREKGGISGNRGIQIYKEWLSKFNFPH